MNTRGQGLDEHLQTHHKGKNYLFAIAIDEYLHSPPLYNCVRDVDQIIALLQREYQFEPEYTYTLFNRAATEKNIFETFKQLIKTVGPEDNLLILYSGHGEFEADIEEGYWIPVDAQLGDFSDYVSNSRIVKYLKALDAHHVLLIVDSCFSGTLFAHRNMGETKTALRLDDIPSRWLITAGRNEVVSDGKPGDNSPFADNIIYFLENNQENSLSVGDLSDAVIDAVVYNSRQTPRGEPMQDVGHRGGQFFFHRKGFVPAPQAAAPRPHEQVKPKETKPTPDPKAAKSIGGSGFWILGAIVFGVVIIVFLAGSLFTPEAEAPAELDDTQIDLSENDQTDVPTPPVSEEKSTDQNTAPAPPKRVNRAEQAWTAAQSTNSEAAFRRFIERFPRSQWVKDAEQKIADKYRYNLMFSPTLKRGSLLEIHFSSGEPPFQINILKPNGEKLVKSWEERNPFYLDLGEMEKPNSELNVLKVVVTDHNYKKAGYVLPVY